MYYNFGEAPTDILVFEKQITEAQTYVHDTHMDDSRSVKGMQTKGIMANLRWLYIVGLTSAVCKGDTILHSHSVSTLVIKTCHAIGIHLDVQVHCFCLLSINF